VRSQVNRNKRGIRINLKHPEGVATLLRLCEQADVLVEGFRPGVMERLGVGWQAVHARNPKLVYCSISGFGHTGPLRDAPGHDMNYAGLAGVSHQSASRDGTPAMSNVPAADLLGGTMTAVMGILAALFDAARSGQGRHVDISITDGLLAHAVVPMAAVLQQGKVRPVGEDKLTGSVACYQYYETADGRHLAVGALERKFWDRFCEGLERPDLKERHLPDTRQEKDAVKDEVAAIIRRQPLAHWSALFEHADCCVTPVLRLEETLAHPQVQARGMVIQVPGADGQPQPQLACPVRMTGFDFRVERAAPAPGQHTDEVLQASGWTGADLRALREAGAIG
jgi:crotonobetainyl-CoA:carnitine CoA-transferase CaiB-like acyl-CoA transferase